MLTRVSAGDSVDYLTIHGKHVTEKFIFGIDSMESFTNQMKYGTNSAS